MGKEIQGRNGGKLKVWEKGESGNPKGRPKKLVPSMKVEGYKLAEINDTIQSIISMTMEELKHVWDNPKSTILEKTVAGALRKSIEKGNLESVETLINRVYGKPKEKIDVETKGTSTIKIEIVKNNNQLNG
jgi:hypothetical protein